MPLAVNCIAQVFRCFNYKPCAFLYNYLSLDKLLSKMLTCQIFANACASNARTSNARALNADASNARILNAPAWDV